MVIDQESDARSAADAGRLYALHCFTSSMPRCNNLRWIIVLALQVIQLHINRSIQVPQKHSTRDKHAEI